MPAQLKANNINVSLLAFSAAKLQVVAPEGPGCERLRPISAKFPVADKPPWNHILAESTDMERDTVSL
jgi:hypothetical protein